AADYTGITAGAAYDKTTSYGIAKFEFSVNGDASSGNVISVDLDAGDATAATKAATADSDQSTKTGTFKLDGGAVQTVTLGAADDRAIEGAAKISGTAGAAAIVTASVNSSGDLVITANGNGAHTLVIAGSNTYAGLNGTYQGTSRTDADLVSALNAGIATD